MAKVRLENAKKKNSGITKSGLDAMPLFLLDDLLKVRMSITAKQNALTKKELN